MRAQYADVQTYLPGGYGAYFFVAMAVAFVASGVLGLLVEFLMIQHLYKRPLLCANPAEVHLGSIAAERIRLLTAELHGAGSGEDEPADALFMKLLLNEYGLYRGGADQRGQEIASKPEEEV